MSTQPTYTQAYGTQPLVSFIIPAYNLPTEMLRECIDSILRLSLANNEREIILVDDGSDLSPLSSFTDVADQLIYVRQPNRGPSAARNVGLAIAKGQFIQFVDGDDALMQSSYEHCLDIVRYQHPDIVVFQSTSKTDGGTSGYTDQDPVSGSDYLRHNNLQGRVWGYIFRHSLFINLRFHEGIIHEDEEIIPQLLLRADSVYYTSAAAYYYRERQGSIMQRDDKRWQVKRLEDLLTVIDTLNDKLDRLPADDRSALQRRVDQLTMDYLYNVIMQTRSPHYLERSLRRLQRRGLYPLPARHYTRKYQLFAKMINTRLGRRLLLRTLPLLPR